MREDFQRFYKTAPINLRMILNNFCQSTLIWISLIALKIMIKASSNPESSRIAGVVRNFQTIPRIPTMWEKSRGNSKSSQKIVNGLLKNAGESWLATSGQCRTIWHRAPEKCWMVTIDYPILAANKRYKKTIKKRICLGNFRVAAQAPLVLLLTIAMTVFIQRHEPQLSSHWRLVLATCRSQFVDVLSDFPFQQIQLLW